MKSLFDLLYEPIGIGYDGCELFGGEVYFCQGNRDYRYRLNKKGNGIIATAVEQRIRSAGTWEWKELDFVSCAHASIPANFSDKDFGPI